MYKKRDIRTGTAAINLKGGEVSNDRVNDERTNFTSRVRKQALRLTPQSPWGWWWWSNVTAYSKNIFFFFHWHYSPLWALACRTMSFHFFFLSATNSVHLLTPSTWRSLYTSSFHLFLGLPLLLVPSSSWVNIFLCILSSSVLSRLHNQLILCPFIHFTMFSPYSKNINKPISSSLKGDIKCVTKNK